MPPSFLIDSSCFPSGVDEAENLFHPHQFRQFTSRVRCARPWTHMVTRKPDKADFFIFYPQPGKKTGSSVSIGESTNVVHVAVNLIRLMGQHDGDPSSRCPLLQATPPCLEVVPVSMNDQRDTMLGSLREMRFSIEVADDAQNINSS